MIWYDHSRDAGKHALLGGSRYSWLNYDEEKLFNYITASYAQSIGTTIHDLAAKLIKNQIKVCKNDARKMITLYLLDNKIPRSVIDLERYLENFVAYVNDAIGFGMRPEQILMYSENAFGTADAILFNEKKRFLRIHDYKSGVTEPSLHQLEIYAALFCLEYKVEPKDISIELRIYWNNEIITGLPTAADIVPIMDKIITFDKFIKNMKEG
jgi:hypothetical protein